MARKSLLTKNEPEQIYCRKCKTYKPPDNFYKATDSLDANGYMSVCKSCIDELYQQAYGTEGTVDKAILRVCKRLNLLYLQSAVEGVKTEIANKLEQGKEVGNSFSVYKRLLATHVRGTPHDGSDLLFETPPSEVMEQIHNQGYVVGSDAQLEALRRFWGEHFSPEDLAFLEEELANWKQTAKCDFRNEELLLQEICIKQLDIRKTRGENKSTAKLVQELQELMKTAALDPAKANAASQGKSADAFGVWIRDIENTTPAEWITDKSIYKDVDNIEEYGEKYITSPLRQFVTGNKEFDLEVDSEGGDADEEEVPPEGGGAS